jgi:5-methylcytosine-specific restriction protein A
MSKIPKRPCKVPLCPGLAVADGYCEAHSYLAETMRKPDRRPSASRRGYDAEWRRIRERALRDAGIPESRWSLYAVDHNPPYNPEIEPDHTRYTLIPRLISEHNRKTAREDGGFGNPKRGRGVSNLYSTKRRNRVCYRTHTHCVVIQGGRDGRS